MHGPVQQNPGSCSGKKLRVPSFLKFLFLFLIIERIVDMKKWLFSLLMVVVAISLPLYPHNFAKSGTFYSLTEPEFFLPKKKIPVQVPADPGKVK